MWDAWELARGVVAAAAIYTAVGAAVAAHFVLVRLRRVDRAAERAGVGFVLVILPGLVALWPWLVWSKGLRNGGAPREAAPTGGTAQP
ncbi:MAG: hypothetical protein GC161_05290 [Planctomycetaceae bacterium]|nr:hypothetical protein [Planctomycetaceae bacterium]